ncbi:MULTISPECIES: helix-turn-helix domain-containing protein [Roseobacteraceae]|uniref:AraC-like ligand-binding domain-containing protein n=1 Tax=Roseobacteraceae TaxID=2854170 RepID=UPI0031E2BC7E
MEKRFTTQDACPTDRFAYWREAVCDSYVELDCATATPRSFHGQIDLKRRAHLSTSYVKGSNQTVTRSQTHVSRSGEETFLVSLQLQKTGFVEQAGRLARLEPGNFALYCSSSSYRLTLPDDFSQVVLQFPKADFLDRLPCAEALTAIKAPTLSGFGKLAAEILPRLVASLDETPDCAQAQSQNAIMDLLVAVFATMQPAVVDLHSYDQLILLRARAFISQHLGNPDLDRTAVAGETGLSVRRLNELFQIEGSSISREIATARLNRIAADLANSQLSHRSISEIAYHRGIVNFQSFSRMFRKRFGQTPSDFRSELASRS